MLEQKERWKGCALQKAQTICPVLLLDTGRQPPGGRVAGLNRASKPYAAPPCRVRRRAWATPVSCHLQSA